MEEKDLEYKSYEPNKDRKYYKQYIPNCSSPKRRNKSGDKRKCLKGKNGGTYVNRWTDKPRMYRRYYIDSCSSPERINKYGKKRKCYTDENGNKYFRTWDTLKPILSPELLLSHEL